MSLHSLVMCASLGKIRAKRSLPESSTATRKSDEQVDIDQYRDVLLKLPKVKSVVIVRDMRR